MPQTGVLHVIGGHDRGKRFDLTLPESRIGRGADQDIVLSDIAVSRRHVTVHKEGLRYRLRDLGSGNGTLVNGQRIDSHLLVDGDHIEIGQTVMRFEHAPSRAQQVVSTGYVPPSKPLPPPASAPLEPIAPVGSAPFGMPPPSMPTETPSDAMMSPPPAPIAPRAVPGTTGQNLNLPFDLRLDTPKKRLIAFASMGALSLICLIIIFARTVFAKPPVVPSEAEELYKHGLRLFNDGDYEGAKISFREAATQAPDAPAPKRYVKQCDLELKSHAALKQAEQAITQHHFGEALKTIDQIDKDSILYDQAQRLRREQLPRAAAEDVTQAAQLAQTDVNAAKAKLAEALTLDPENDEALRLQNRWRSAPPAPVAKEPAPVEEEPVAAAPPTNDRKHGRKHAEAEPELAPVHAAATKTSKESSPSGAALSGNAMVAYKSKDFVGAEKSFRLQATQDRGGNAQRLIEAANQVRQLRADIERASTEEGTKPDLAIRDYQDAMAIDQRVGKGVHAGWLKQKVSKLELGVAQQAFGQGKYDVAFSAAKEAQRGGVDAGAILKQLDLKAADLVQKGQAMQKSNVAQAKNTWRMVLKMVAPGSPSYTKAYQLLNNATGPHRDEDED